jgi:threonine dehydrogenase-like Zn-dependent dehydrogenase
MRALTVQPGVPDSLQLEEFRVPGPERGSVLLRAVGLGVCGTDREIISAKYGKAPPGHQRLIIGHESLAVVEDAPDGCGLVRGDLAVGVVRHPDPVPCPNCAAGEWDMCRNGQYTEHGINSLDGFGSEWYRLDPKFVIRVEPMLGDLGVLVEPASVVAKAWEHTERIGRRALWQPSRVLVTGAGPVGLLAALLGAQRNLSVHVLDRADDPVKSALVRDLGASFHVGSLNDVPGSFDVVMECTGAKSLPLDVTTRTAPDGIVCLIGVSAAGVESSVDVGALNRALVLGDRVIFGSVNANRRHYEAAMHALAAADPAWLRRLITRRVPLDQWRDAFVQRLDDVKTVIEFSSIGGGSRTNVGATA